MDLHALDVFREQHQIRQALLDGMPEPVDVFAIAVPDQLASLLEDVGQRFGVVGGLFDDEQIQSVLVFPNHEWLLPRGVRSGNRVSGCKARKFTPFVEAVQKVLIARDALVASDRGFRERRQGMHEVVVRAETPEDVRAIDVVNLSAFEGEAEARLVDAIRRSPAFIRDLSLVAEINGRIVGHLLLSPVTLQRPDGSEQTILALGPMSVVPSQSHRGIGSALIQAAVNRARDMRYRAIVVAGQPDYYRRFGFRPASEWGVTTNLPLPEDAITAMELVEGSLEGGGEARYPEVFRQIF
ncbi:MAG TPA: N-acetyltransferase [Thiotrichales bacterium]|nr:N-acetyltransferase [Thiotrichales bacterium]